MAGRGAQVTRTMAEAIAAEAACRATQVEAAAALLDGGATVPFVARYRKEATGGLDDAQLRKIEERLGYLRELEARKEAVSRSVEEQGKMTDAFRLAIGRAATKAEVEDLYLPYRPRRKTRADAARERGLGPLAERILAERPADPSGMAEAFLGPEVADVKAALEGARDIVAEQFADNPKAAAAAREHLRRNGMLKCRVVEGKEGEGAKFADYFDRTEPVSTAPGHRVLAMLRARDEGVIVLDLEEKGHDPKAAFQPAELVVMRENGVRPDETWLAGAARWAWRVKLASRLQVDLVSEARERAEAEAISVFSRNLKDLLLAAPAGPKAVLGLDPGIRTGVKAAVVDGTGKLLETATLYPFQPRNDVAGTVREIKRLAGAHGVELVAVGNGTGGRETEAVVQQALAEVKGAKPIKVTVSEAGASVYSASELASEELPGVDVSLRGAVSIARRLQDPLAELVKIEPKSIGVGQYQHDVDQAGLGRALDAAVEDAVNAVGVDVNTASPALLARVSGIGRSLAASLVAHRDAYGAFRSRERLKAVPGLGPKAFEQCAGFLRIRGGDEPLDASGVHPEAYGLARRIVAEAGSPAAAGKVQPQKFVDAAFGLPTVKDVIAELQKPGRDPRPGFKTAVFDDAVREMSDLRPGMKLEGTVTNVAAFGAFVDIGVHQDGLVHVSELSDSFVKDPAAVVKAGQVVRVTVLSVDVPRKRISLSMKTAPDRNTAAPAPSRDRKQPVPAAKPAGSAFGDALRSAMERKR